MPRTQWWRALRTDEVVDYAFEAVGRSTTIEQTIAMARRGGTVVIVPVPGVSTI